MKCKNCTHYQNKDWSINYECALGHKTPDFGDTESCTDFNESWASEIIRGLGSSGTLTHLKRGLIGTHYGLLRLKNSKRFKSAHKFI
jgi:hypothetical protein